MTREDVLRYFVVDLIEHELEIKKDMKKSIEKKDVEFKKAGLGLAREVRRGKIP